jgi:hypothetical protein
VTRVTFAAKVLARPLLWTPERLKLSDRPVCVRNPYSGRDLWLSQAQIVNTVNDVACVSFETVQSGRRKKLKRAHREFINPATGNTFLVHLSAIQETT